MLGKLRGWRLWVVMAFSHLHYINIHCPHVWSVLTLLWFGVKRETKLPTSTCSLSHINTPHICLKRLCWHFIFLRFNLLPMLDVRPVYPRAHLTVFTCGSCSIYEATFCRKVFYIRFNPAHNFCFFFFFFLRGSFLWLAGGWRSFTCIKSETVSF